MGKSYATIDARAADKPPFSSSTEGHAWTARWCDTCTHDRGSPQGGCLILLVGLSGKTPAEWLPRDRLQLGWQYRCTEYRKDNRPEPAEIAGQLDLFGEGG
jgi:hypothetical protein